MQGCAVIGSGFGELTLMRHDDEILRRSIICSLPASNVPNFGLCCSENLLGWLEVDHGGSSRWVRAKPFDCWTFALVCIEHHELTHQGESGLFRFAVGVLLRGLDWLPEDDLRSPRTLLHVGGTLLDLAAQGLPLVVRPPELARECPTLRGNLEQDRIDAPIELFGHDVRGEAAVLKIGPRLSPRQGALLKCSYDLARHSFSDFGLCGHGVPQERASDIHHALLGTVNRRQLSSTKAGTQQHRWQRRRRGKSASGLSSPSPSDPDDFGDWPVFSCQRRPAGRVVRS